MNVGTLRELLKHYEPETNVLACEDGPEGGEDIRTLKPHLAESEDGESVFVVVNPNPHDKRRAALKAATAAAPQLEPGVPDMRVVLLANGALIVFRADSNYRVLRRIGNKEVPDSFLAHELAAEYDLRAAGLRRAIAELR